MEGRRRNGIFVIVIEGLAVWAEFGGLVVRGGWKREVWVIVVVLADRISRDE